MVARIAACLVLFAIGAQASIIFEETNPSSNEVTIGGPHPSDFEQVLGIDWSATASYSNVDIQASIQNASASSEEVFAWLTTAFGTGANSGSAIESAAINVESGFNGSLDLFSDLSLAPGQYYLILYGSQDTDMLYWQSANRGSPFTTGDGITGDPRTLVSNSATGGVDPTYAPASSFVECNCGLQLFTITGDETPEPNTQILALVGLLMMAGVKARRVYTLRRAKSFR